MIVSSSSSNVDGRWISRGYAGQKLIDGEHVQYGAGLSTTLVWEGATDVKELGDVRENEKEEKKGSYDSQDPLEYDPMDPEVTT